MQYMQSEKLHISNHRQQRYIKKLDKTLEEAHLNLLWKVLLKMVILQCKEESVFSVKLFEDILEYFKQCTPTDYTHTEITELEQFFDSVEKCTHSVKNLSQVNNSYDILYERMITYLKSQIKFLIDEAACKDTYFHGEINFLRQQLETALSKQENVNIDFRNNCHRHHIPRNIVNSDDSFITTDYHTKATGSDSNTQTYNYINNENTDNIIASPSTENSPRDYTSSHVSTPTPSVNKKKNI